MWLLEWTIGMDKFQFRTTCSSCLFTSHKVLQRYLCWHFSSNCRLLDMFCLAFKITVFIIKFESQLMLLTGNKLTSSMSLCHSIRNRPGRLFDAKQSHTHVWEAEWLVTTVTLHLGGYPMYSFISYLNYFAKKKY